MDVTVAEAGAVGTPTAAESGRSGELTTDGTSCVPAIENWQEYVMFSEAVAAELVPAVATLSAPATIRTAAARAKSPVFICRDLLSTTLNCKKAVLLYSPVK
ncbi:hypothetical protein GCM10017774_37430 [Lentzea cavernae]|uniref:Uncharacterized protein n=1 Tax=Lentzea cavernae TaxID=2020703 RepID=A0ABQ3ME50_9PSEU|nr:hypothetical protein GCM10017774_37430 [Lentzea cavernae]